MSKIFERLGLVREHVGMTQTEMAKNLGVSRSYLSQVLSGTHKPSIEMIVGISTAFQNIDIDWLLTGEGEMFRKDDQQICGCAQDSSHGTNINQELFAMIPRYDVSASAGHGAVAIIENILDYTPFRTDWLRDMRLQCEHLGLIYVEGDSMQPTLQPNDMLLVDMRNHETLNANALYVLNIDGCLFVKRLQKMISGAVKVISDNPQYETEVVQPGMLEQLIVVGRVVWVGKRV